MNTTIFNEKILKGLFLLTIASALTFLYLPMVNNWFFIDDLQWIWTSSTLQVTDLFFSPEVMRSAAPFFTPMLGVSFMLDWLLFGLNPVGYSVHNLISLIAATIALYLFIRLYTTQNIALAGCLLFLLNPSTLVITSWFSARHYMEGLFFALLSLFFFVNGERKGRISILSGFLYLIASLSKEIYVVLPVLAFLMARGKLADRTKYTMPFFAGLIIYIPWRLWVMKGMGGYYNMHHINFDSIFLGQIINFVSLHWFGEYYYVVGYFLLFATLLFSFKNVRVFIIFLVLFIPILPVGVKLFAGHYAGRYFFHIFVYLLCVICLFLGKQFLGQKKLYKYTALLIGLFVAVLFSKQDYQLLSIIRQERSVAKEVAMELVYSGKPYVKTVEFLAGFYRPLQEIYHNTFGIDFTTRLVPPMETLKYCAPERLKEMRAAGIDIPYDEILKAQERFRKGPLSIKLTYNNYKVTWDFGPDKHKEYVIMPGPFSGLYYGKNPISPTGSTVLGRNPRDPVQTMYIRILYQSDNKEEVVSPEFAVRIPGNQTIEYSSN